jgi:type IV secretion system protein VirD4
MVQSNQPIVASVAQEMLNKHIEERSGVLSTAVSLLSIFRDPLVADATDMHDFTAMDLRKAEKPIIMLNQIGRVLTEQQEQNGHRVLMLLDEFPALGRLEFFESALAYMAGYGLKAFLICQSLNQLQKAYGERNAILDNCHVRVAFANNDDQTARRLSNLLGEQTLVKKQTSFSGGRFDAFKENSSVSDIEFGRPLLLPSEINRLPQDQEIIFINGMYPLLANKLRYFSDQRYSARVVAPKSLEPNPASAKTIKLAGSLIEQTPTQHIGGAL